MFKRIKSGEKIKLQFGWLEGYVLKKESYPLTLEIDATNACPLSCAHCVWEGMRDIDRSTMSEGTLNSIIEQAWDLGIKGIVWTGGGEPLANPHVVGAIKKSKSLGIRNGMFTNGLFLTRKRADILCDCLDWVRFNLGVSNSSDYRLYYRVTGNAFETVCNNIKYYCEITPDRSGIGIGTVANQNNFELIKSVPVLSHELGASYCQIKPDFFKINSTNYVQWWEDYVEAYFLSNKKVYDDGLFRIIIVPANNDKSYSNYCHAHHVITSITANGAVSFCKMRRDEAKTSIGNINESGLREIFDGDRHKEISATITPRHCSDERFCPYSGVNNYVNDLVQAKKYSQYDSFF
jgi:MoaA/NifB/PqqE/SkfB family radical SAM enzyme